MAERMRVRGLFVGHDYVMTKDQLLDVRLVSNTTRALIVVIPIVVFLFGGGNFATLAFFVPVVVYPPLIELISHYKERSAKTSQETAMNHFKIKKIRWEEVDRIQFEGGLFVISTDGGKKKFTGFVRYSDVSSMANYIRLTGGVVDITIRKVDWIYAFGSLFLAALSPFVFSPKLLLLSPLLLTASAILWLVFVIKLIRSRTMNLPSAMRSEPSSLSYQESTMWDWVMTQFWTWQTRKIY